MIYRRNRHIKKLKLFKSKNMNVAKNEDTKKKNTELRRFISSEDNKIFTGDNLSTDHRIKHHVIHMQSSRIQNNATKDLPGTRRNLHQSTQNTMEIPDLKQIIFLVDTESDIFLVHEAYIKNKNLPRVDPIIIFGVTTHSIKTKYGVIIEMFGKKYIFHVLDNHSL